MKPLHVALLATLAFTPATRLAAQARPAPASPASSAVGPIAFISIQKLLTESAPAKEANQQLEVLRKAKQDDVNAKKKALDDTKLALANAGGVFSTSRRAELQKTEQRQEIELKTATEDAQKAFLELQRKLQGEIRTDIGRVLNDIMRERPSIQYVLNTETSIVWARNAGNDLTADVLERLNRLTRKEQ